MKRQLSSIAKTLISLSALLLPLCSGSAAIVYDNTANALTNSSGSQLYYASTSEFGNQIVLAPGTNRVLSQFDFYYYYSGTSATTTNGPIATIRFYKNDGGTNGAPGTGFFTSDPIMLVKGYVHEALAFNVASNFVVPNTFTWTVQFSNLGTNLAGLLVYGPPTVGFTFDDFWVNTAGTWSTFRINGGSVPSDFAARFGATVQTVPPTIASFSVASGNITLNVSGGTAPYQVQVRTNFTTDNWADFGPPFTNGPVTFPSSGGSQRFFRIRSQ